MNKFIFTILGWYFNKLVIIAPGIAASQAFKLFCFPIRPPLKENHKKFLNEGMFEYIILKGKKIQVYKWGNGPKKILFLHGWQSHSFRWKSYLESFSPKEFTMYSLDAPGHGYSQGNMLHLPLYSEVISLALKTYGPFHSIIGHSLACFAIAYTFYQIPDLNNSRLVFLGTPGNGNDFLTLFKQTLGLNYKIVDAINYRFQKMSGHSLKYFSLKNFGSKLQNPGLIIHEKTDREAPYHYAVELHEVWKNSSLMYTEGLNHKIKSDEVVRVVKTFIELDDQKILHERSAKKLILNQ